MPIPTVDSTKKIASKKIRRGDPDFLLFSILGWKKFLVKMYHHHHQPVVHQFLTVIMILPLLSTSGAYAFECGGVATQRGVFASLFPDFLACFLSTRSPKELTPTSASESI